MKIDGLNWEVWRGGEVDAVCRLPEDAAVLASAVKGAVVVYKAGESRRVVWREGKEDVSGRANDGYTAGEIMVARVEKRTPFE